MAAEPIAPISAAGGLRGTGRDLARLAILSIAVLLAVLGLLMLWRRVAGALESPLAVPALVAAAALFAALAGGIRLSWRALRTDATPRVLVWAVAAMPAAAVVMLGLALSLPGTSATGLVVLWGLIALEEAWAVRGLIRRRNPRPAELSQPEPAVPPDTDAPLPPPAAPALPSVLTAPDEDVIQQLVRSRDADGAERLSGWLRASFAPGQRTESVHLAFCPPFERTPRLAVNQSKGPAVRVKTAQLLPYGARLDLKLAAAAAEAESVLLEFTAESPPPSGS